MKKTKNIISDYLDNLTQEERDSANARVEAGLNWIDEHPDYNERYGTDRSYFLETIKERGLDPVGITTMLGEETIIFKTKEESNKAWELFKPNGFWYCVNEWEDTREWYTDERESNGITDDLPKVYCLDNKYKDLLK